MTARPPRPLARGTVRPAQGPSPGPARRALLALVACALAWGCSEDDTNPVGADQLPPAGDPVQEVVLEPVFSEAIPTAGEDRGFGIALVGARQVPDASGFESRILLRFALAAADTALGTITVDDAAVRVLIDTLSADSVRFSLHRLTEDWSEGEVSWEERAFDTPWAQPGGTFDPIALAAGTLRGDSTIFSLPDSVAQSWLDRPESNDGLILLLEEPGAFARLVASTTTGLPNENGPELRLSVTRGDTASVSEVLATSDAHIAVFAGAILPGLAAGNEPFLRSVLRFDISSIPANASINRAELQLVPRQVVSPVDTLQLQLHRVASPFLGGATVFATGSLDTATVRADTPLTFSAAALAGVVRAWQLDPTLNLGLGIQAQRRSGNLGFVVYGAADAAPADRPFLRVVFTPPLQPDFGRRPR